MPVANETDCAQETMRPSRAMTMGFSIIHNGLRCLRAAIVGLTLCAAGVASAYPNKPIRMIHPYAPGGGTETQARALAQYLNAAWGQPVIIDSRAGAGSAVGTQIVAKSTPDGYTLLFTNVAFSIVPNLSKNPLFDPVRDFTPVVHVGTTPSILVVHSSLPPSLKELIVYAKLNPGKLHFGSSGIGAASHLYMEYLQSAAGISMVHVPYRGSAPAVVALLAGEVQVAMFSASTVIAHIRSGKIRALAVTTRKRSEILPDVPSISAVGVPGYEVLQWSGVLAPAGTPKDIIYRLNHKINQALSAPHVKEQLRKIGVEPAGGTSDQFASFIRAEVARWRKVINDGGITAE